MNVKKFQTPDTAECPWCLKLITEPDSARRLVTRSSRRQVTRIDTGEYLVCRPCWEHFEQTGCESFSPGRWAAPANLTLYCESCDQDLPEDETVDREVMLGMFQMLWKMLPRK